MSRYWCPHCRTQFRSGLGVACPHCPGSIIAPAPPRRHITLGVFAWVVVLVILLVIYLAAHNAAYRDCFIQPPVTAWPSQCL